MLDTDILILLEKGNLHAEAWLLSLSEMPSVSGFAAMEFLAGSANKIDKIRIERFIEDFQIIWPDARALDQAVQDDGTLRLRYGIGVLDVLVAITAINHNQALVTFNERHFRAVPGLTVLVPFQR